MSRRRGLLLAGIATLILFVILTALDLRMRDAGGPGIVGFEFAGSEERATEIRVDWGDQGTDAARLSLWLDYLYLLAYGALGTLAVGAVRELAERRGLRRIAAAGAAVIFFPAAAAAFDALEDVGLLLALDGHGGDTAPLLAAIFATFKFVLAITPRSSTSWSGWWPAGVRKLTQPELNRALLARQLLLERARSPLPRALERTGGIQAQYAPSMYVGLWTRLEGFERDSLTRALERRSVVQGTLHAGDHPPRLPR